VSEEAPPTIHATAVALGERAVLLQGPPGSGKSDFALRLIESGWTLVADDRVVLTRRGVMLFASPPPTLAGLIEARGIGICRVPFWAEAEVVLAVQLVSAETVERLPQVRSSTFLGLPIRLINMEPFEASAPAKLRLALGGAVVR
jgi:serine kinase of HPr protein (carbohydrate metabolism regulator)